MTAIVGDHIKWMKDNAIGIALKHKKQKYNFIDWAPSKHHTIIHHHSFAVLKQKGINPMQNADPRLNVSQQQHSAVAAVNNVGIHQNNGLNSVQANMGPVGNPPNMHSSGPPHAGPGLHAGPPPKAGPGHIPPGVHNAGQVPVQQNSFGGRSSAWLQTEMSNLQSQQSTLQDQVRQSEQNLAAQHAALMAQQQGRVEDAVRLAQENTLQSNAQNTNTDLIVFDSVLQPIIDSCTKDSISAGKAWILQHSITLESNEVIAEHLLKRYVPQILTWNLICWITKCMEHLIKYVWLEF